MAIRQLVRFDDEIFRKISKPVTKFDQRLWDLLDDMSDTLKLVGGFGCAAVHFGVLRRAIVVNDKSGVIELINPTITETSSETHCLYEASIAIGAPSGYVERPYKVTISAVDRYGEQISVTGEDFLAAAFCHEIDHLDGVLFMDKALMNVTDPKEARQIFMDRKQ